MSRLPVIITPVIALVVAGATVGLSSPSVIAQSWQPGTTHSDVGGTVSALKMWDADGPLGPIEPVLVGSGSFTTAGTASPANRIATWNGTDWSAFGGTGLDSTGTALATFSSNNNLFVSGALTSANSVITRRIAGWDPSTSMWYSLDTTAITALTCIAKVNADTLVVCGVFSSIGGVTAKNIATWNPTTGWAALADGINPNPFVCAALSNGDILVSTGSDTTGSGATTVKRIGRWDGTAWHQMGAGFTPSLVDGASGLARCLLELPNGDVIAGGSMHASGTTALNKIGRWDHAADQWLALGSGINSQSSLNVNNRDVYAAVLMPNGDLVVGGDFNTAGGTVQNNIARWNFTTSTWSGLAPGDVGLGGPVRSLAVLPNGDLAVGGDFLTAGGMPAARFAIWHEPVAVACPADFDGLNGLNIDDIFVFLNAWFAGLPSANFDGQNGVQIDDIFVYLNAWFAGCP